MDRIKNVLYASCVSFALSYYTGVGSGSIVNLIFLGILYYIFQNVGFVGNKRMHIFAWIGGVFYSFLLVLGRMGKTNQGYLDVNKRFRDTLIKDEYMKSYESANGGIGNILISIVVFCGMAILLYFLILCVLRKLPEIQKIEVSEKRVVSGKKYWIIFFSIIICWLPYFIINYPGVLTYDSIYQISQCVGDIPLNSHHPVCHTLLIKLCYDTGIKIFGNPNAGVAIYAILQMTIMAMIYSYLLKTLLEYNVNRKLCIAIWAFYAIIPLNALYAVIMWKNILNAGFVLLFLICLFKFVKEQEVQKLNLAILLLSEFLAIMFLKNAVYAFIATVFLIFILLKGKRKKITLFFLPIICSLIITGPICNFLGVLPGGQMQIYGIPLQQISRVVVDYEDRLTEDEINEIEKINSIENIKQEYMARLADPILNGVPWEGQTYIFDDSASFWKLYIKLGSHYPKAYLMAEIDATVGYWYPDIQYIMMFYGVSDNNYGIYPQFENTTLYAVNKMWGTLYYQIPLLGNIFSIGTFMWVIFAIGIIWLYQKKYKYLALLIYPIMLWGTIMAAVPLFSEMRYIYSTVLAVPFFIACLYITVKLKYTGEN